MERVDVTVLQRDWIKVTFAVHTVLFVATFTRTIRKPGVDLLKAYREYSRDESGGPTA